MTDAELRQEAEAAAERDHDTNYGTDSTRTHGFSCTRCAYFTFGYLAGAAAERPRTEKRARIEALEGVLVEGRQLHVPSGYAYEQIIGAELIRLRA